MAQAASPPPPKYRGMVVARRILRRSAAASKDQGSIEAELVVGTISRTHVWDHLGARMFILIWTAILLLPEDGPLGAQQVHLLTFHQVPVLGEEHDAL